MGFTFLPQKTFFGLGPNSCQQLTSVSLITEVLTEANKTVPTLKHLQDQAFGTKLPVN